MISHPSRNSIRLSRISGAGSDCDVNIPGQVLGKTECGFYVKTGDTMLEVVEYTYDGRIKVGDRLKTDE